MTLSADVYSMTNPALGALALWKFVQGYEEAAQGRGCEFSLLFLPLPLVLSRVIRQEFSGSNAATGLIMWIEKKPQALIDLAARVETAGALTKSATMFALKNGVLRLDDQGLVCSDDGKIHKTRANFKTGDERKDILAAARTFGVWSGELGSARRIYSHMGIKL
ncbi:hypothetical protein D3C72_421280 [compost metagenome]